LQVFSLIYLQKFAVGSNSFQLGVPMLIMLASMVPFLLRRAIGFNKVNLAFYLLFVGLCFCSQVFVSRLSVPSFGEVLVLYAFFVIRCDLSNAEYECVMRFFINMLVLPSFLIIFQFLYQKITGRPDPLNMDQLVPNAFLMHGFIYHAPYHFGFAFTRPNGFFFLETSFASAFTAAGAVIEATYFRRPGYFFLLLLATFLSLGGTGLTLLIAAAPFLLARESQRVITLVLITVVAGLLIAYVAGVPLPLISRIGELDQSGSSGAERLLLPLRDFVSMLSDPGFVLSGTGAGTASNAGSVWPVVKLLQEYGLIEAVSFVVFYLVGIFSMPSWSSSSRSSASF
jgi:hypothetical protein